MPLPSARRLVRALLVATLTGILLGAAVGASNGTEAQSKPAVFVPAPHLGDRGAYTLRPDGSYDTPPAGDGGAFPFLAFQWQEGTPARAGDGLLHATDRVQTSGWEYHGWAVVLKRLRESAKYGSGIPDYPVWVRHNESLVFERGAPDLLASDGDLQKVAYNNQTIPRTDGVGGVGPVTREGNLYQEVTRINGTERTFSPGAAANCLFASPLQNRTLVEGDEVSLGSTCDLHGVLLLMGTTFRAAGMEQVHGVPAMRLDPTRRGVQGDGDSGYHFGGGTVTVWMANGIPYPVRVSWSSQGERLATVLDLASFQPGSQPRLPPVAPGEPAPPVTLAPPRAWGLDEAGVRHPYPMSAAFTGARDDANFATLRTFLKAHPDAYVASAVYSTAAKSDAPTARTWKFTVTDGESWLDVAAKRTDAPSGPLGGLPVPVLSGVPGGLNANTSYSANGPNHASAYFYGLYPTPPEAPDLLPTVASMLARWEAYASPGYRERGPDNWGFQIYCFRVLEKECRSVWVNSWAGHIDATAGATQVDQSTVPPTLRTSGDGHSSLLLFFNNATQALVEGSRVADSRTGVSPAPPLGSGGVGAAPEVHAAVPLSSWVPTAGQAAGVGVAAVAVGLLYYLWPLAKGGLGLFSRLKEPEVLGHPARQQLLQLIEAEPGIHFKEMARRTGLPNGSLVHHLETLRRGGQVVARPAGGYTLYFLGAHVPAGSAETASALKADGARKILDAVRQQPGLSSADVAARCGLQPSTVTYHVQRLQAAGLLTGLRDGRAVRLHPVEAATAA
ncbi:MAG: hypothetical protein QOG31_1820 [Thermoplasmata archaeon]|jgi:DNA-binding transcriptional ArsR family regulator|nr:hypothetical protein [Thermoplasmata archaeon]